MAHARSRVVGRCRRWTTFARVRRVLRVPTEDAPRPSGGLAVWRSACSCPPGLSCTPHPRSPAPAPTSTEQTILRENQILRGNVEPQKDGPLRSLLPAGRGPARRTCRSGGRTRMNGSAATCGTTWRFGCRFSCSARRPSSTPTRAGGLRRAVIRRSHPARDRPTGGSLARTHHSRGRAHLCIRHPSGALDGDMGDGRSGRA